jgi:hypothetical protein
MPKRDDCRFKTPFNKSVPHWYWHTSKQLLDRDRWLTVNAGPNGIHRLQDSHTKEVIFQVPAHYGEWAGYLEQTSACRLSGQLGRLNTDSAGHTMCL